MRPWRELLLKGGQPLTSLCSVSQASQQPLPQTAFVQGGESHLPVREGELMTLFWPVQVTWMSSPLSLSGFDFGPLWSSGLDILIMRCLAKRKGALLSLFPAFFPFPPWSFQTTGSSTFPAPTVKKCTGDPGLWAASYCRLQAGRQAWQLSVVAIFFIQALFLDKWCNTFPFVFIPCELTGYFSMALQEYKHLENFLQGQEEIICLKPASWLCLGKSPWDLRWCTDVMQLVVYEKPFRLASAGEAQPHSLLVSSRQGPVGAFLIVLLLILYFLPLEGEGTCGGRRTSQWHFSVEAVWGSK